MFQSIVAPIPKDPDYPARRFTIDVLTRVLEGAVYDHIESPFHQEKTGAGDYVPIRQRRPCVKSNLCRVVVDDAVALLFSEGHFPTPDSDDAAVKQALIGLSKHTGLNGVMLDAATLGSVGSAAVQMRVLPDADGAYRIVFEAHSTEYLTPTFDPARPDRLVRLVERYKVKGADLDAAYGLTDAEKSEDFWFQRAWDEVAETWFWPLAVEAAAAGAAPRIDEGRSVAHRLGFTPWVWIRNLPGRLRLIDARPGFPVYSDVDGACTFAAAVDAMVEIDYQLSQAGRGLKYSMDPMLLIKEPAAPATDLGRIVKGPANALVVDERGDAKLLEIGGEAFQVVLDYVRALRELALEAIHGNRADAQKLATAQSGRAMELMNQTLIWLADRLRVSYGEGALLGLLKMALKANAAFPIALGDEGPMGDLDPVAKISLIWPAWYAPTAQDRAQTAQTLSALTGAGLMSRETAVKALAADYDVEDVDGELGRIEAEA
jgi:hypothetical protein